MFMKLFFNDTNTHWENCIYFGRELFTLDTGCHGYSLMYLVSVKQELYYMNVRKIWTLIHIFLWRYPLVKRVYFFFGRLNLYFSLTMIQKMCICVGVQFLLQDLNEVFFLLPKDKMSTLSDNQGIHIALNIFKII